MCTDSSLSLSLFFFHLCECNEEKKELSQTLFVVPLSLSLSPLFFSALSFFICLFPLVGQPVFSHKK